ncbi:SNF2 family helicase [Mycena indigotica]|uniref:SNF2 family helicase n=1 Tax=Mycena indigotica TaxID=2126181 RepID=A0A8H6T227_9AGAR|nr:SNF2 family helicase [Mycena indigotica]KAF7309606.1 SNF2 family helicase [Mycena indigotica]
MTRFAAFADSSDDDEVANDKSERAPLDEEHSDTDEAPSITSSESSSDLETDDLLPHKSNTLVPDENGDYHYRETRWPLHMGVDAQKMHVMQTSLFRVPEEAAAMRADNAQTSSLQIPLGLNRKHSRDSDGDGLRFEPTQRASFAQDVDPPIYKPTRKYARVDRAESAVVGGEAAMVDAGLAFGRSFRVGWGPCGLLAHPGTICAPNTPVKTTANTSTIFRTLAPIVNSDDLSAKLLQHQLSHSPIDLDDEQIPFANPSSIDLHFSSFAALFPSTDRSFEASLFRLGSALFDLLPLRLGDSVTPDIRTQVTGLRRKAAVSAWLEDTVASSIDSDIRALPSASPATLAFIHLTGNQIKQAAGVAADGGYLKLATLISQAGGDLEFRSDLRLQLDIWRKEHVQSHVEEDVRKVYTLLAGLLSSEDSDEPSDGPGSNPIDLISALDWKRVFGLHLWYSGLVDSTISQVFDAFSDSMKRRKVSIPPPWYIENPSTPQGRWKLPSLPVSPDALYSLMRLHADPSCSLSQVLDPLSFSSSPLDYSLPWHLYIILSRCMGVRDFSDRGEPGITTPGSSQDDVDTTSDGHSPSADLLTNSYASQLEQHGMVQEAVFVLLHIEGSAGRAKVIKDLLARNAHRLDEWTTRGIVGSLRIPMAWVQEAKAIYALHCGNIYDAFELYLSAELFNEAHNLAISKLAPDAIIRNDLQLLASLFRRFEWRANTIDGWHLRGKALLDYSSVLTRLEGIDDLRPIEQEEERDNLARDASKLIGVLPNVLNDRSNTRHSTALATMISALVSVADRARPLSIIDIPSLHVDETVTLQHLQSSLYARFVEII